MIPLTKIYIIIGIFCVFGVAMFLVMSRWPKKGGVKAPATVAEAKPAEANPAPTVEAITKDGEINARVIDVVSRTIGMRHVELTKGKDYGRERNYLGKQVYYLRRTLDRVLEPVMLPGRVEETPGELYGAFQVEQPLKNTLGPQETKEQQTRLIMIAVLCGIALFADMVILVYKGGG